MNDIEYRPQPRIGVSFLIRGCVALVLAGLLVAAGSVGRAFPDLAPLPAAAAVAWFAGYALRRRRRGYVTQFGIASRHLLTRRYRWDQIRDIEVVRRVTVANVAVVRQRVGTVSGGRGVSRSGGGARKIAWIRVQLPSGRWRRLAMPAVWEDAADSDFTSKAEAIRRHWLAATGQQTATAPVA